MVLSKACSTLTNVRSNASDAWREESSNAGVSGGFSLGSVTENTLWAAESRRRQPTMIRGGIRGTASAPAR